MDNFRIGIGYLKKYGIDKFGIGIEVSYKKKLIYKLIYHLIFNSEIFFPWQSYLEYKLFGVLSIPSRYSE